MTRIRKRVDESKGGEEVEEEEDDDEGKGEEREGRTQPGRESDDERWW